MERDVDLSLFCCSCIQCTLKKTTIFSKIPNPATIVMNNLVGIESETELERAKETNTLIMKKEELTWDDRQTMSTKQG